jgi:hypothetical protein
MSLACRVFIYSEQVRTLWTLNFWTLQTVEHDSNRTRNSMLLLVYLITFELLKQLTINLKTKWYYNPLDINFIKIHSFYKRFNTNYRSIFNRETWENWHAGYLETYQYFMSINRRLCFFCWKKMFVISRRLEYSYLMNKIMSMILPYSPSFQIPGVPIFSWFYVCLQEIW